MILKKREKILALFTVGLLALVVLYQVYTRLRGSQGGLEAQRANAAAELERINTRLANASRVQKRMNEWGRAVASIRFADRAIALSELAASTGTKCTIFRNENRCRPAPPSRRRLLCASVQLPSEDDARRTHVVPLRLLQGRPLAPNREYDDLPGGKRRASQSPDDVRGALSHGGEIEIRTLLRHFGEAARNGSRL